MVIFINFPSSLCGGTLTADVDVLGLPHWIKAIFLGSGIAMVLQNVTIGQLMSQVNASHCMLDYINTHFMTFTYWCTALIEFTGVMHISYLLRTMSYWAAGKPVASQEPPMVGGTLAFYWLRVMFSAGCLGMALAVTIDALFQGQTALWNGVPPAVGLLLFLLLMTCVGLLEGMQIAFFAVSNLPKSERGSSPMALRTCECLFKEGGKNLPGFMCGRQVTVTLCFFVIARVTTITVDIGTDDNIFGVANWVQTMFNLGFMGALTTTILGSIAWQLVAGAFPIAFLSNPIVYIFLQVALVIEALGFCAAAWFFGMLQRKAMGYQFDDVYVGTPEERAAKGRADKKELNTNTLATVLMATGVGTDALKDQFKPLEAMTATFSNRRTKVLSNIKELRTQLTVAELDDEVAAYEMALTLEIQCLAHMNAEEEALKLLDAGNKIGESMEDEESSDSDDDF
jgi:hypothetical protein